MAIKLKVKVENIAELKKEMAELPEMASKCVQAALKRTESKARTTVSKSVRTKYNFKAGRIKGAQKASKKRNRGPFGQSLDLIYKDRLPSLISFNARQFKYGVKATVKKGNRASVRSAFIQAANGGTAVFKREGGERYPIKALRTVSVPQAITNEEIEALMLNEIGDTFQKRLLHEWNYRTGKL